jgi:YgiT-type zinc finger domain-containing protein
MTMNPKLSKCPTCGRRKLKLVHSDYSTRVQGRAVVVPDLERQECPNCGEVLFDCAAMERLDALRTRKRPASHASR